VDGLRDPVIATALGVGPPAPVVKWISHRPPEPGVEVRFLSGALGTWHFSPRLLSRCSFDYFRDLGDHLTERGRFGVRSGLMEFPKCLKCRNGVLIPLSDYGQEGAAVIFKAWACTDPDCGFSLRVDKGEVTFGRKIEAKR
jgi:hypothetical protein